MMILSEKSFAVEILMDDITESCLQTHVALHCTRDQIMDKTKLSCFFFFFSFRYTAENSVKIGAFRDTDHPVLRQMSALDVWKDVVRSLDPGVKITVLTNGPLTNLAQIIRSKAISSRIQVNNRNLSFIV